MSIAQLHEFGPHLDMIQLGARNMQNFDLLKEVGKTDIPVLLKRGLSATIEEWLMSAEYILAGGNENVVLCERGIRTYETAYRNVLDLNAVPMIKKIDTFANNCRFSSCNWKILDGKTACNGRNCRWSRWTYGRSAS